MRHIVFGFLLACSWICPAQAVIQFADVSAQAGIAHAGPSFGAGSWGDVNGDGLPDLWVGNHANKPNLYLNNGNGTFTDVIDAYWLSDPYADTHGAVWTDVDRDGVLDLVELVGAASGQGAGANHLFFNVGGMFIDQAAVQGLDYPLGRGRTPLPLDVNRDGNTDFVFSGFYRAGAASELFINDPFAGVFSAAGSVHGFAPHAKNHKWVQLADLNNDNHPEIIVAGYTFPDSIFDWTALPMQNVTAAIALPRSSNAQDSVFCDLNGDLYTDAYVARAPVDAFSEVRKSSANTIRFSFAGTGLQNKGFTFSSVGVINFDLGLSNPAQVFIGSSMVHPATLPFTLNATDPNAQGWVVPTLDGIYIGYDAASVKWRLVLHSTTGKVGLKGIVAAVGNTITLNRTSGLNNPPLLPNNLIIKTGNGFAIAPSPAAYGRSVVAGDFDNDMDLDLYVVQSGTAANRPNVLLENTGGGTFVKVANAGGATGTGRGIGDSVSIADYDADGYLDLFVTNGEGAKLLGSNGPQQLFHNQGTGNNWIEIDLKGLASQAEGIGATVYVTAGGVTQVREQNAGMHKHTQNHTRLHFGLAQNAVISTIKVVWPSGLVQLLQNVAVNQVLPILEP